MPPQMYLVECVLPSEPAKYGKKSPIVVYRWVFIAYSDKEATSLAQDAAQQNVGKRIYPEYVEASLAQGVWSASMVGQGMQLHSVVRDA